MKSPALIIYSVMAILLAFAVYYYKKHPLSTTPPPPPQLATNTVVVSAVGKTISSRSKIAILKDESTRNVWVLEDEDPFIQETLRHTRPGEYIRLVIEKKGSTKRIHSIHQL